MRQLEDQVRMLHSYPGDPPAAFEERFRTAVTNAREVGLPAVRAIVDDAERLGLAVDETARLSAGLRGVGRVLRQMPDGLPDADGARALDDRLSKAMQAVHDGLFAIRKAAALERSTVLAAEFGRVLSSRRDELRAKEIALDVDGLDAIRDQRVVGTSQEMTFVIDNLVENAISAMEGSTERRLSIAFDVRPRFVVMLVEDTGKGIPEGRREQIFVDGVSEKDRGGHGLPAGRRILGRRGGGIRVLTSTPGEGTTFEVRFERLG
jgi:signal transduction histidine kinase